MHSTFATTYAVNAVKIAIYALVVAINVKNYVNVYVKTHLYNVYKIV